jgi:hypothetical protein
MGYAHKHEQEERDSRRDSVLTGGNQGLTTVYATMQPGGPASCPSASMGIEWMGSDSDVLDVTVKRVAKESIVVSVVEVRMRGLREMLWICLKIRDPLKLAFIYPSKERDIPQRHRHRTYHCPKVSFCQVIFL